MNDSDPSWLKPLRALPTHDLDPLSAERLRREVRAAYLSEVAASRWSRLWNGVFEPAAVTVVVLVYGHWALAAAVELTRHS